MEHTFKTNINCSNCIKSVSPFLNKEIDIDHWEVDTENADKILKVQTDLAKEEVVKIVEAAGFEAEPLN